MFKRLVIFALTLALFCLSGCSQSARYEAQYWDTFDTQVVIIGYAKSQAEFDAASEQAHQELLRLHALFDRYHAHPGTNGVYALNQTGSIEHADDDLIGLLLFCDKLYEKTDRRVNPAMGTLLKIWSDYRSEGIALPPMELLREASEGMSPMGIHIDEQNRRITLDPGTQLDLGAVGKGYAVERAAQLLEVSMPSFLIDAGGNIRTGAPPLDGRDAWMVGINDPSAAERGQSGILIKVKASDLSVVSSGGYQRYYELDGKRIHHIIDPDTLMPGGEFLQTTILTRDSALADYLSTVLFLLPYERGRALIESMDGVDAVWVLEDKTILMTPGAQTGA